MNILNFVSIKVVLLILCMVSSHSLFTEKKIRGNGFVEQSEGIQPDIMKNFLVARTVQTTMGPWEGGDVESHTL